MTLPCPQCGAPAPAGTRVGTTYACRRCGNPVLAVAPATPPARAAASAASVEDAPSAEDEPAPAAPSSTHWKMGVLAFVVLGAAYIGAYELLTAEAQRDRANLRRVYGPDIESFPDPGASPPASDSKALREYRPAKERWDDRRRYEALGTRVHAMFLGLLGAFTLQGLVTAALAWKTLHRPPPARRSPRGLSTRST